MLYQKFCNIYIFIFFFIDQSIYTLTFQALRISLEEERARQEAEAAKAAGASSAAQETQPTSMDVDKAVGGSNQNDKTDDDMLAQALAMSSAGDTRVCIMDF